MRGDFILRTCAATAAAAAGLFFDGLEFAIQKFDLLLLFVDGLIEFLN